MNKIEIGTYLVSILPFSKLLQNIEPIPVPIENMVSSNMYTDLSALSASFVKFGIWDIKTPPINQNHDIPIIDRNKSLSSFESSRHFCLR